jgi:hypothetical protein
MMPEPAESSHFVPKKSGSHRVLQNKSYKYNMLSGKIGKLFFSEMGSSPADRGTPQPNGLGLANECVAS